MQINLPEIKLMSYEELLAEAISLTHHMLALAANDDWESVIETEVQRGRLLMSMKNISPSEVFGDVSIEKNLRRLLDLNEELTALGERKKTECFNLLDSGKRNIKAFDAYTSY